MTMLYDDDRVQQMFSSRRMFRWDQTPAPEVCAPRKREAVRFRFSWPEPIPVDPAAREHRSDLDIGTIMHLSGVVDPS